MNKCLRKLALYCYVCGKFSIASNLIGISVCAKEWYEHYFGMQVVQGVNWAPKDICRTCYDDLRLWFKGTKKSLKFGVPMIWTDPALFEAASNTKAVLSPTSFSILTTSRQLPKRLPMPTSFNYHGSRRKSKSIGKKLPMVPIENQKVENLYSKSLSESESKIVTQTSIPLTSKRENGTKKQAPLRRQPLSHLDESDNYSSSIDIYQDSLMRTSQSLLTNTKTSATALVKSYFSYLSDSTIPNGEIATKSCRIESYYGDPYKLMLLEEIMPIVKTNDDALPADINVMVKTTCGNNKIGTPKTNYDIYNKNSYTITKSSIYKKNKCSFINEATITKTSITASTTITGSTTITATISLNLKESESPIYPKQNSVSSLSSPSMPMSLYTYIALPTTFPTTSMLENATTVATSKLISPLLHSATSLEDSSLIESTSCKNTYSGGNIRNEYLVIRSGNGHKFSDNAHGDDTKYFDTNDGIDTNGSFISSITTASVSNLTLVKTSPISTKTITTGFMIKTTDRVIGTSQFLTNSLLLHSIINSTIASSNLKRTSRCVSLTSPTIALKTLERTLSNDTSHSMSLLIPQYQTAVTVNENNIGCDYKYNNANKYLSSLKGSYPIIVNGSGQYCTPIELEVIAKTTTTPLKSINIGDTKLSLDTPGDNYKANDDFCITNDIKDDLPKYITNFLRCHETNDKIYEKYEKFLSTNYNLNSTANINVSSNGSLPGDTSILTMIGTSADCSVDNYVVSNIVPSAVTSDSIFTNCIVADNLPSTTTTAYKALREVPKSNSAVTTASSPNITPESAIDSLNDHINVNISAQNLPAYIKDVPTDKKTVLETVELINTTLSNTSVSSRVNNDTGSAPQNENTSMETEERTTPTHTATAVTEINISTCIKSFSGRSFIEFRRGIQDGLGDALDGVNNVVGTTSSNTEQLLQKQKKSSFGFGVASKFVPNVSGLLAGATSAMQHTRLKSNDITIVTTNFTTDADVVTTVDKQTLRTSSASPSETNISCEKGNCGNYDRNYHPQNNISYLNNLNASECANKSVNINTSQRRISGIASSDQPFSFDSNSAVNNGFCSGHSAADKIVCLQQQQPARTALVTSSMEKLSNYNHNVGDVKPLDEYCCMDYDDGQSDTFLITCYDYIPSLTSVEQNVDEKCDFAVGDIKIMTPGVKGSLMASRKFYPSQDEGVNKKNSKNSSSLTEKVTSSFLPSLKSFSANVQIQRSCADSIKETTYSSRSSKYVATKPTADTMDVGSTSIGMFESLLDKAAAAVQSATQAVNQATTAVHLKTALATSPESLTPSFDNNRILVNITNQPDSYIIKHNHDDIGQQQQGQRNSVSSENSGDTAIDSDCGNRDLWNDISVNVTEIGSNEHSEYYIDSNQNQKQVRQKSGKKLPTIITNKSGCLMRQQQSEMYDGAIIVNDMNNANEHDLISNKEDSNGIFDDEDFNEMSDSELCRAYDNNLDRDSIANNHSFYDTDNDQVTFFTDSNVVTSHSANKINARDQHQNKQAEYSYYEYSTGSYDYQDDYFNEEDEYKYLAKQHEQPFKQVQQQMLQSQQQRQHHSCTPDDACDLYSGGNYHSDDSGEFLEEISSGSTVGATINEQSAMKVVSKVGGDHMQTHLETSEVPVVPSEVTPSPHHINKQNSLVTELGSDHITSLHQTIVTNPNGLIKNPKVNDLISSQEPIHQNENARLEVPTTAAASKRKVLKREETEEVVCSHMYILRKPEVTAKQRWHWAYNKIIMQFNTLSEKLIEMVRAQPCLYEKRDHKYKDLKHKEKVWEMMSQELNFPVKELKIRWKSLRDRFRREKNNENGASGSSQKLGPVWKYRESLEFLSDSMEPASTTGNVEENDYTVEWLHGENSNPSPGTPTIKRKNYMMTEILTAMMKKYEEALKADQKPKYSSFFALLGERFDRLHEHEVDDVQLEILQFVNRKLNNSIYLD